VGEAHASKCAWERFSAGSSCPRPASRSWPTATCSRRRCTSTAGGAAVAPAASSPTSAILKIGDLVVHEDHGIGRFEGLETLELGGSAASSWCSSTRAATS
jgi:hypothetical protein